MILQHALNMASMIPQVWQHCVTSEHVLQIITMMLKPAYQQKDETAKFKLCSLLLTLQRTKVQGHKKGFSSGGSLWLHDVNHLVYKVLKHQGDSDLVKH